MLNSITYQIVIALMSIVMQGNFCFGQTDTLAIDSKASQVTFTIKHLGVLNVDGKFSRFDGSVTFKKGKPHYIESIIDVASIGTNDSVRDRTIVSEGGSEQLLVKGRDQTSC